VLVEVARKAYLASIVPVIVNAILNEHQIVVDIVAFVNKGDFPRSRLGEKQRGKILAGWVSRKLRTMAQFSIKDMDREALAGGGGGGGGPPGTTSSSGEHSSLGGHGPIPDDAHRASLGSFRSASGGPFPGHAAGSGGGTSSSLRNVERAPQILEQRESQYHHHPHHQQQGHDGLMGMSLPQTATPGPIEMPATPFFLDGHGQTPRRGSAQLGGSSMTAQQQGQGPHGFELPDFDQFGRESYEGSGRSLPPPAVGPKPGAGMGTVGYGYADGGDGVGGGVGGGMSSQGQMPPQIRLPGVDGRESLDDWDLRPGSGNGTGVGGDGNCGEEDDWTRDAYKSMNLAGTLGGK
jgi:hypothetical protein